MNPLELIHEANAYRNREFTHLSEHYGISERTIRAIARNKMTNANVFHSALEDAKHAGAAGFAYTHIMQTVRVVPAIMATLDNIIKEDRYAYDGPRNSC